MKRRVCPVCDQMMESAHYCKNCKSFVKDPWMREVDYYLNERHPVEDHACSYHDDPFEVDRLRSLRRGVSADERYTGKKQTIQKGNSQRKNTARSAKTKQEKKIGKILLIIFIVYLVCQIAIPLIVGLLGSIVWFFI